MTLQETRKYTEKIRELGEQIQRTRDPYEAARLSAELRQEVRQFAQQVERAHVRVDQPPDIYP